MHRCCRVIEMETLDLGLSPEGEALNNRSVRDRTNSHQHNKAKKTHGAVFNDRHSAAAGVASGSAGGNHSSIEGAEGEGEEEEQDEREVEGDEGENKGVVHQHFKRRRIQFRNVSDAELAAQDAAGKTEPEESETVVDEVYNQNALSDEQFISLQNRIKNRPVSAVNGTYEMHIARPVSGMKGHTAFLTFAVSPLQS